MANNNIYLGDSPLADLDAMERELKARRAALYDSFNTAPKTEIWDKLNTELSTMTDNQKSMLLQNNEYAELNAKLQAMISAATADLVKGKIEGSEQGRALLKQQYELTLKLKEDIVKQDNMKRDFADGFLRYAQSHPNATLDDYKKSYNP